MALLEYDPVWMEWGYLSAEELAKQVALYRTGDDRNTEHSRYHSFRRILSERTVLSENEIAQYLALTERDPDAAMARAARADLLQWRGLLPEQFEQLSRDPRFAEPHFQKLARRRRLFTALEACSVVSEALFAELLASQDARVQRALVDLHRLTPEQYALLAAQGINRAIRNLAHAKQCALLKRPRAEMEQGTHAKAAVNESGDHTVE